MPSGAVLWPEGGLEVGLASLNGATFKRPGKNDGIADVAPAPQGPNDPEGTSASGAVHLAFASILPGQKPSNEAPKQVTR